ncbi:pleckstrin homology domain-containing family M member 2 [Trichogramma pretiosum]|uniref:pleckstrin homology domain-containing family M member 2 n=1 Tax=Trichogramma pretiosum TaxID=7493 RepID=UPI000C71ABD8|nr:pleckstrin homology domain-containing family M member 2 [Trichogramma pretiosum]
MRLIRDEVSAAATTTTTTAAVADSAAACIDNSRSGVAGTPAQCRPEAQICGQGPLLDSTEEEDHHPRRRHQVQQQSQQVEELRGVVERQEDRTKLFLDPLCDAVNAPRQAKNLEMPGQDVADMELCTDKVLSKERILQELTKAVKLIYIQSLHGSVVLDGDSWLVYWLDRALRHGLRVERHGYWGTVRELSHQDTVVVIHALQNVLTSIGKGRAWLYHTLSEGSFESYLACMLRDAKNLKKQYFPHALVRDADRTNQLVNLLAGLENVSFTLQLDVTYLDICNYMPQRPMRGSPSGVLLNLHLCRQRGSLSSGVDTDMDASNDTDNSGYKEEDWSTGNAAKYHYNRCKMYDCENDNRDTDLFSSSSHSSDEAKLSNNGSAGKFHNSVVTNSDIINQNVVGEIDDEQMDCSSLDTVKNYNYLEEKFGNSKQHEQQQPRTDAENNGIRPCLQQRSSFNGDGFSFKKPLQDHRGSSYVINNDTNLLELSMTISDCDNTEAPYSILNTVNVTDTGILSTSSSDSHVQKRHRKKKRGDVKKRVSFHEDIFKMMKLDDEEDYVDTYSKPCPPLNETEKNTHKVRHSWCSHGDSSFIERAAQPTRQTFSDYYSSSSTLSGYDNCNDLDYKSREPMVGAAIAETEAEQAECAVCELDMMCERGVPEGQEDPAFSKILCELEENEAKEAYVEEKEFESIVEEPEFVKLEMPRMPLGKHQAKYASSSDWSDLESVTTTSDSVDGPSQPGGNITQTNPRHLASPIKKRYSVPILSLEGNRLMVPPLRSATSKTSLLSRFLRSLTERKLDPKKDRKTASKFNNLRMKGAKVDKDASRAFDAALEREVQENTSASKKTFSGERINLKLREVFRKNIYRDKTEQLYKVYKVRSSYMTNGESKPMLALLTDKTLYLTGIKSDQTYSNQFVIPYNELDVILIGPNAQTILISNADYEMQYLFSTGSSQITSELITHLEMAMRRSPSKPRLPAVKELNYDDMHSLKHSILAETAVHPDEKIEHYGLIYMEDDHMSPPTTPCGPTKEGDLMFRPHVYETQFPNASTSPWEAGYFVLKGGVVYMFTDSNQRLPKRAIPLKGGLCMGCRRIPNSHRPHTFEILLKPNKAYQFAAPDEYVASEWLQSFVQSASGLYDCSEKRDPLPCSLVVTTKHMVTMKEVFSGTQRGQTLSCASIEDLTAFRVPLAQQSWCILEFACREVHENSGDWVVYFTNSKEFCAFRAVLESLWTTAKLGDFPISTISPEDKLHHRCSDANKNLEQAWKNLLPLGSD